MRQMAALLLPVLSLLAFVARQGQSPLNILSGRAHTPDAEALVPIQNDIISGYYTQDLRRLSNADEARHRLDPDTWLSRYRRWGRVDGALVNYTTGTDSPAEFLYEASVYSSEKGAKEAFTALSADILREMRDSLQGWNITRLEDAGDYPFNVGEEWSAGYVEAFTGAPSPHRLFQIRLLYRRDNVVAVVEYTSRSERPLKATVRDLARLQDSLIRQALAQGR